MEAPIHELDLWLPAATRRSGESGTPAHAPCDRRSQEEERPHRCCEDLPTACAVIFCEAYMAPAAIRQRRRTLRYRKLLIRQNVQLKNKVAQMLMESGVSYSKQKLHQQGYFHQCCTWTVRLIHLCGRWDALDLTASKIPLSDFEIAIFTYQLNIRLFG
jgi:hypothetical protein